MGQLILAVALTVGLTAIGLWCMSLDDDTPCYYQPAISGTAQSEVCE